MSFQGFGQRSDRPSVGNRRTHLGPAESLGQGTAQDDSGETFAKIS